MDVEYIRSSNQNYLKVPCLDKDVPHLYQYKMIAHNHIKGLLQSEIRQINGISYLYYNISSIQSVANCFMQKEIDGKWVTNFFEQLRRVAGELERHLLDSNNLVFDPEYIFQDIENGETFFLYYPYHEIPLADNFGKLAGYMVTKIGHQDEDVVEKVYKLYEKVELSKEFLCLTDVLVSMEETKSYPKPVNYQTEEILHPPAQYLQETFVYESCPEEEKIRESKDQDSETDTQEHEVAGNQFADKIEFWIPVAVMAGMIVLLIVVWQCVLLSVKEMLLLIGLEIVVIGTMIKKTYGRFRKETKEQIYAEKQDTEQRSEQIESECMVREKTANVFCGKTIYLDEEDLEAERKLYGAEKYNKIVLTITQLPYTIGKQKEYVDGMIHDASVSRMHARFFEKEQILYLEDLNSTNGTYKNGLRLEPNETVKVEIGDEIQFGKIPFTYR